MMKLPSIAGYKQKDSSSRCAGGQQGLALLLVLSMITLLVAAVVSFNQAMSSGYAETNIYKNQSIMRAMTESGMDIAMAVLHTDGTSNQYDHGFDSWSLLGEQPIPGEFSQGVVEAVIVDHDGKFPINALADEDTPWRDVLYRLLTSGLFVVEDEVAAREIVDSLADWLDEDDNELPYGAESGYYLSRENGIEPRNGPFVSLAELSLVKGVTTELLYGTDEHLGLREVVTILDTGGTVNLNTVRAPVLMAIDPRINAEHVEKLEEFRADENNAPAFSGVSWYRRVSGWPADIELPGDMLKTDSQTFTVTVNSRYLGSRMSLIADLVRDSDSSLRIVRRTYRYL
jgi:general secretion pathway protein K